MKLTQKKCCGNCRALTSTCQCELRYTIENKFYHGIKVNAYPLEPCPKPLTINDYLEAIKNYKK